MMNVRQAPRKGSSPWFQFAAALLLAALLCAPWLQAQSSHSAPAAGSGPRALAVLELAPDGSARLVPIAIRINNKFYDAGLYRAMPRPLAVDPQTVYEVQRSGAPLGLFTVTRAQTIKDVWVGLGQWRPMAAQVEAKKPAPPAQRMQAGPPEVDDRPVLRRPGGSGGTAAQSEPAQSPERKPAEVPADDSRPTLKRPAERETPATEDRPTMRRPADSDSAPPAADDRPTLKRPADQTASAPAEDEAARPALKRPVRAPERPVSTGKDDADRPTLRRGKPVGRQGQDETAPLLAASPGAAPTGTATKADGMKIEVLPAISDAQGKDSTSLLMMLNPAERRLLESKVQAVAYGAIQKWVAAHPQTKAAAAEQLHLTAFQVFNLNRDAVSVYTAELSAAPAVAPGKGAPGAAAPAVADPNFRFFVTVVTRTDMYGELRTLLSQVTDSRHLDAYRRLDLIDGVDAEGTGTGQLLFRRVGDRGFSYGLYRVGMDRCWPIFESAEKDM